MKRSIILLFFILGATLELKSQVNIPQESQLAKVEQQIGFTDISISYSRPNMNGRALFGEMIPWNSVWRTGANANTKINVSKDVFLNDHKLPKGTYALYTIPNPEEWTIIINTDTSLWGHYGYKEEKDLFRFKVKTQKSIHYHESFTIAFENLSKIQADIKLYWENLAIPFQLKIDEEAQHKEMMAVIDRELQKPDDHDSPMMVSHNYLHAAMYFLDIDHDLDQALNWVNKAIELKNVSYFHLYKAEILGKLNRYEEAIKSSQIGLAIFMKTGKNKEWIWRYNQQIDQWKKALNR